MVPTECAKGMEITFYLHPNNLEDAVSICFTFMFCELIFFQTYLYL